MEASPTSQRTLRPLGVGEILDRAVTLCVRNFPLLALIWGVFAVVSAVLTFLGTADQSKFYGALADAIRQQSHGGTFDWSALARANGGGVPFNGWTIAFFAWIVLLSPLPTAALIAATSFFYLGRRTTFGEVYRIALHRFLNLFMYNLLWLVCVPIVYIVFVLAGIAIGIALFALAAVLHTVGIVINVILGTILGLAFFAFALVAGLGYSVGFYTCVIERRNFAESFTAGLRRVFARAVLGRSLLLGLVYLAVTLGYLIVSTMGQAVLYGLVRSQALGVAYTTLLEIAAIVFLTTFITIFYYDLRVREEGFDLQLSASDVAAAANA